MLVVCINGPKRVGKDTTADEFLSVYREYGAQKVKFATPLKEGVHASLGLRVSENYFEECKDVPRAEFFDLTPRQAYIKHSEEYMKVVYGQNIFAELLCQRLQHMKRKGARVVFVSDCGFQQEVDIVSKYFRTIIIQIRRANHTFEGDSRGYIEHPRDELNHTLYNQGTLLEFIAHIRKDVELNTFIRHNINYARTSGI